MPSTLQDHFFQPSSPPSPLSPNRWPGISHESTSTLQRCLKDNHERWHIFFNEKGFHNHASHHLLAIWAMGASAPVIDAAYKSHCSYMRPRLETPESITEENFCNHLADQKYYHAYLVFFMNELEKHGLSKTLEKYIFSAKYNTAQGKHSPDMLCRFLEGVFHPFIHLGNGAEFGLPGIAAEGLAMTAVHSNGSRSLMPQDYAGVTMTSIETIGSALEQFSHLSLNSIFPHTRSEDVHLFTILARMLNDKRLDNIKNVDGNPGFVNLVVKEHGDVIREYAELWVVDTSNSKNVADHVEQLIWVTTMIYGIGGWSKDKSFNADFFAMHFVTSVVFAPSILAYLNRHSQSLLLRGYLVQALAWWLARGRPQLAVEDFFTSTSPTLRTPPGPHPKPVHETLPAPDSPHALTPNAWLPMIQTTLVHPNEHLPKIQRALAHFAALYGNRQAGYWHGTELEGADKMDGTLFVRAAALTQDRLGWMREGGKKDGWDFKGYFEN